MMLGLARLARNELSILLCTFKVDETLTLRAAAARAIVKIFTRSSLLSVGEQSTINPDNEFAIVGGEIFIP